ncbi:unnamed protein product [Pseudo-nitzschia multistriata]|uniref:Uncharacterized protein n=1 Tax=Pseudo-nitzschia multistriata TaxID=183589 RepID=A0A448ZCP5_9STRA|nr:unnamed protein product [Pseudo-nitzschia multistriata]
MVDGNGMVIRLADMSRCFKLTKLLIVSGILHSKLLSCKARKTRLSWTAPILGICPIKSLPLKSTTSNFPMDQRFSGSGPSSLLTLKSKSTIFCHPPIVSSVISPVIKLSFVLIEMNSLNIIRQIEDV